MHCIEEQRAAPYLFVGLIKQKAVGVKKRRMQISGRHMLVESRFKIVHGLNVFVERNKRKGHLPVAAKRQEVHSQTQPTEDAAIKRNGKLKWRRRWCDGAAADGEGGERLENDAPLCRLTGTTAFPNKNKNRVTQSVALIGPVFTGLCTAVQT